MIKKGAEKNLKYKDCTTEIERMLTVNTKLIPVIIGATGTISKSLRQFLSNVPGKHEIKVLHKTAILCTAHTLTAGSATVKVRNMFNMGNNMTCSTDCKHKTDTGNNRGDWNHLKITQTVPEQRTGKTRN